VAVKKLKPSAIEENLNDYKNEVKYLFFFPFDLNINI